MTSATPKDDRVLVLNRSAQPIHAAVYTTKSEPGKPGKQELVTTVPGPNAVPKEHAKLFEMHKDCCIGEDAATRWKLEAPLIIRGSLSLQGLRWVRNQDPRVEVKAAIDQRIEVLKSRKTN